MHDTLKIVFGMQLASLQLLAYVQGRFPGDKLAELLQVTRDRVQKLRLASGRNVNGLDLIQLTQAIDKALLFLENDTPD